ncbi:ABC transporter substrate-binding protein [Mesorhizobium sp. NBSH29]|uniref:ABC transporter substrate-binding protein n=1 Tax=Mesorhizobium sp. NBSH29 TaxID=2654249 RepID=UPI0018968B59|nr:ABC transporter substrate-binding protein [Mesorhizobium sp. NBSH29]QPC87920.1 ABC transporter substrate-binding protein [Mesorhizobium sp. NBSH29]
MIRRRTLLGALASTAMLPFGARATSVEPDFLQEELTARSLPPMAERLPKTPRIIRVAEGGGQPGRYGGIIRTLVGGQRDIRMMTIYGYARLVGYDEDFALQPDILERFEVVEDRIFTFTIREGHKWSDGSPLTPEDFRYSLQDVWLNEDLTSGGLSTSLLVNGKGPLFEILDPRTVRYSWESANPDFLPSLASAAPLSIVLPAEYLKQFHEKYQDSQRLAGLMRQYKAKKWTTLHIRMARQYRPENPDLPMLDPWTNTTRPPASQFIFKRNPFYHRVDENGLQLPYIDQVVLSVSSAAIIPAKAGAGETDLQAMGLDFTDYTFLKDAEKRHPISVKLWKRTQGSRLALLPNLNTSDPVWRDLMRDVRMRRALSLAINRREINKAVFYGLGTESADTVLPESPLYKPEFANAWIAYDPEQANTLLDAVGLDKRNDDGIRLLPDGRPAQIIVETAGESTDETDVLELITDHWRDVGIALFIRTSQREVLRSRGMGGEIVMSMGPGLDNGVPTADMNPRELAPTSEEQLQWPLWGVHFYSAGKMGAEPDLPEAAELVRLVGQWKQSPNTMERAKVWQQMLALYTDQVFTIGLVNATLQPILASAHLRNVPDKALYGFDPTSYFGVYMPDTFWLGDEG